jgi:predicted RNA methylase
VLLTRIYSATIGYNYAYLIISIALGGLGIGALLTLTGWTKVEYATIVALSAISIPLLLGFLATIPASLNTLSVYFVASCIPFVLSGLVLAKALVRSDGEAHSIYFADLLAASLAPPVAVALLYVINPQTILLLSSTVGGALATVIAFKQRTAWTSVLRQRTFALGVLSLLLCAAFLGFNFSSTALTSYPTPLKPTLNQARATGLDYTTTWNPVSRIDVYGPGPYGYGIVSWLVIDGDASTPVLKWNSNATLLPITHFMLHVPYALAQRKNVLVIGAGGGTDVDEALMSGAQSVTAVEVNPTIVNIVRSYGSEAGNIYSNPKVNVFVDEGRSFLARSQTNYDLIDMTLVDSWAAVSSGAYSTSEAYLYTTDAFRLMINHLTPNGTLVIVRWDLELPKVLLTLTNALEENGVLPSQVAKYIAVLGQTQYETSTVSGNDMIIVKRNPFTSHELAILSAVSPYKQIYVPNGTSSSPYGAFFAEGANETLLMTSFPNQRIIPATDNSPFYFDFDQGIPFQLAQALWVDAGIAAAIGVIAFFPKKKSDTTKGESHALRWSAYYSLIGLGFILVEISLLQRLTLLIGYPTIAFASLLFFLLVSSACGSLISSKVRSSSMPRTFSKLCALVAAGSAILVFLLPSVIAYAVSFGILERVGVSGLILVPLGILMGMPFPSGLRWLSDSNRNERIPSMLGINFIASVIGSILGVIIGIYIGLGYSLIAAAACYAATAFIWLVAKKTELAREKEILAPQLIARDRN